MKKKYRVLHIINSHIYSGAENVIINIMENTKDDFDVCYTSPTGSIKNILEEKNLKYIPILDKNLNPFNIRSVINQYRPDIIHAHDFRAGIFTRLTFTSIPIINHLHNNSPWLKKYSIYTVLYAMCCYRFNQILTVSDSVMRDFVFGSNFESKVQVVANPFDANTIKKLANMSEVNYSSDIIFIGRLTPQKNIFFFLDIIKCLSSQMPSLKVAIVGDGELRQDVELKIEELGLSRNIVMYGFQKNPYGLLKHSKILCMPSRWEGFGLVAAEALSLGKPVICSGVGGLKDIVNDRCGKICNLDKEIYNKEIKRLLTDKEYRLKKVNFAFTQAEKLSNLNSYIDKIKNVYHEVLWQ